jgi:hypothetical protein
MTQYAYFDSTASQPTPVLGWYDTEEFNYSSLPAAADLLELTPAQWESRASTPFVDKGTLVPPPPPTPAQLLAQAQAAQIATLQAAYQQAIQAPVSYTSKGGVTKIYQADPSSVANLQSMLLSFGATQTVPSGFYWVAADDTQVPFTYADLQGLAQAFGTQGWAMFQHLQTRKAAVKTATTVAGIHSYDWKSGQPVIS